MTALRFALRLFRRDWRNGELRLLALALVLAVTAVSAVGFFTDRVGQAMELQAGEALAADLVLSSHNPLDPRYQRKAAELSLESAQTLAFPSAVLHDDRTRLVMVKAVSDNYPLRGELRTRDAPGAQERRATQAPTSGELWADARLFADLAVAVGDSLDLGEQRFRLAAVVSRDSGEASNMFRLGPSVLMNLADIPATGLVTPASRVHHRLLIAGAPGQVQAYRQWAEKNLDVGVKLNHLSNARPALRNALERGGRFLGLSALVAVLIASAAVALSSRRFVERQADASAILRCLGATRPLLVQVLLIRLLLLLLCASSIGLLLGHMGQLVLTEMVARWFTTELPPPGLYPLAIGVGTGLVTLLGFTLPPVLRLGSVPPLRVLRRDLEVAPVASWILALFAFAAMALLMLWQAGEAKLALLVMTGALASTALLLLTARLMVALLTPLRHHSNAIWRYGLAGLARNPALTSLQMAGFGLGILALLLLTLVRTDLLAAWERTIPDDAPNQFLINIQPQQVEPLHNFLQQKNAGQNAIYPMLRARLTQINSGAVSPQTYDDPDAQRLVAREFNLSYAKRMQSDNRILQGHWWSPAELDQALFSVEQSLARRLRIELGDRLVFDLAGTPIEGRVSSIRSVQWDSFQPNFFVIGTPGLLEKLPTSYITSFYLQPGRERLLSQLVQQFPSVTTIDVAALLQQVREIMARGAIAVEYVFLFTLFAGVLVLYAGIQASREHRRQESAILRTLGLKRRQLLFATMIEFLLLGVLAGALASACASLTGWAISDQLFALEYRFNPLLWLAGTLGGGIGIAVAGVAATWPLVIHPPLQTLRGG
ncbi:MAG: ABC transporter permease [Gammaproteobacteria bacterium]|nr:ABC transporter permease [Gammaproteobacteria bacterium]